MVSTDYRIRQHDLRITMANMKDIVNNANCDLEWSGTCETEKCEFSSYEGGCSLKKIKSLINREE